MKKFVLALATMATEFTASAAFAGQDELPTQFIRKATESGIPEWTYL